MADLTRFDFHAMRFIHSEDVLAMSAEEVGQYILLLCHAWLSGKDASLPSDKDSLARFARVDKISPRVMKKFDLVDTAWGKRFRNETLYAEWMKAQERSDNGKKAVTTRWNNERADLVIPKPYNSNTDVSTSNYPSQAIPSRTEPDQTNQSNDSGDFKNLAIRYRRAFATRLSGSKNVRQRYSEACRQFSENIVLEMFDNWSQTAGWIKDWAAEGKLRTDGLKGFYNQLPEMLEIEAEVKKDETATQQKESDREANIERSLEAGRAASLDQNKILREEMEEDDAAAQRISSNPSALFGKTK